MLECFIRIFVCLLGILLFGWPYKALLIFVRFEGSLEYDVYEKLFHRALRIDNLFYQTEKVGHALFTTSAKLGLLKLSLLISGLSGHLNSGVY